MIRLHNNAWFKRLWVVQEAVLAPSVQVFFGSVSLPLEILVKAMENYWAHTPRRCCLSSGRGHYNLRGIIRVFLQNFNPVVRLRGQIDAISSEPSLLELCLEFLDRRSSMDLDRIYALQGLLRNDEDIRKVVPDYDRPTPEVYLKVSSDYIELTASLLPLFFAGLKNRYPELPSWAIDWTIFEQDDDEQYRVWELILPLFRLSNDLPTTHIKVEEKALIARGVEVDVITALGTTMDQSTYVAFQASMENWRNLILLEHQPEDPYVRSSTWNDAWLRTLCADCCWGANSARRANSHDIAFFSANLSVELQDVLLIGHQNHPSNPTGEFFRLENGVQVPSDAHFNDIWGMVKSVVQGRKLFLTKKGYLGLCNDGSLSGDKVFVFPGAPTPLILRRKEVVDGSSSQQSPTYMLISGCYIHGFMDDRDEMALGENKCWDLITIL
jgi:hypothetical protein